MVESVTYQLLDRIDSAADVRAVPREELPQLCAEVRSCLIDTVSKTAGHLASGLGVVELTVALHYVYNTPHDVLVWDVGHQAYPHKILTGHRKEFATIRQHGGLHAFIWRGETPYDVLSTGHASTSIGSALGLAVAERNKPDNERRKVVAIIGDGAMSGGCAFEALNHAGSFQDRDVDLTVILNDNEMSISENVGGLAQGLAHIIASPHYVKLVEGGKRILKALPTVRELALRAQEHAKGMIMLSHHLAECAQDEGPDLPACGDQEGQGLCSRRARPNLLSRCTDLQSARGYCPQRAKGRSLLLWCLWALDV